jgi:hypothetical protein
MLMSVDLRNSTGQELSFSTMGWALYLNLAAVMYHWEKAGTLAPQAWAASDGPWEGAYDWNAGQIVTAKDAGALADALEEYLADPAGREKIVEVADDIGRLIGTKITVDENDSSFIRPLIDFARLGEFEIW